MNCASCLLLSGEVHSATVISDQDTGRSRGFGFIEMDNSDADKAISQLNGQELDGRQLRINEARERTPPIVLT